MKKYDKQFLIDEFFRFTKINGRYPYGNEMKAKYGYPSKDAYLTHWNTWDDFLNDIGVLGENGWYKCDEDVLKEMYANESEERILDSLMIKKSWNTVKGKARKIGLKRKTKRGLSEDFLIKELHRYFNTYGRSPLRNEFIPSYGFPNHSVYSERFGGWNKALKLAGLETNINLDVTKDEIIKEAKDFYKKNSRSPYNYELEYYHFSKRYWNTYSEFLMECGLPVHKRTHNLKSKEDGLNLLKKLHKKLNRVPKVKDLYEFTDANLDWYWTNFGGFENALYEAGIISAITEEEKINHSIEVLKKLAEKLERHPFVEEYENFKHDGYSRRVLEDKLKMSYSDICLKYLDGYEAGCYSQGEEAIKAVLKDRYSLTECTDRNNHLIFDCEGFITQKSFHGLTGVGGGLLTYDFYIPKYKLVIEFQGKQHEEYIEWFHRKKENFKKQIEHDKRKQAFAKINNLNFLEIWYWEIDRVDSVLTCYINKIIEKGLIA